MNVNHNERIDYLLAKFYAVESSTAENDELFEYFLYTNPLPDCYADDMPLIRAFAIMRYCKTTEAEFRQSLKAARQTAETRKRLVPKPVLRIAAAAACVAAIAIGFWAISTDAVPTVPTYDMLQPTQVAQAEVPAKQHTQQLNAETGTTTTDNEMKNTAVKPTYKHTETIYAEHKGDIEEMSDALYGNTAAADIVEQEPQPILLAEAESKIHAEQYYADTAYMIADAEPIYNNLEMYCSTKCMNNEVIMYLDRLMENTGIM